MAVKKKRAPRGSRHDKVAAKVFGEVRQIVASDTTARTTVRELMFARLVAEEGYTLTDAYIEAMQPNSDNQVSINAMASKLGAKPRVKREIERVRMQIADDLAHGQDKFRIVNDGKLLREEILKGLYSIATSDAAAKDRSRCWELLGKCRHVDMFAHGSTFSQTNNTQINNLGVANSNDASELRSNLVNAIRVIQDRQGTTKHSLLGPSSSQVIDTKALEYEEVEP